MNFRNQVEASHQLESLANANTHSIIISGPEGSGKSYLAKQYANYRNIVDIQLVSPTVQTLKSTNINTSKSSNDILIIIENLDSGVMSASYSILKYLEEPDNNVYCIVTCRNIYRIPDTIISRCSVVNISNPIIDDINLYCESINQKKYNELCNRPIWSCIRNFSDFDTLQKLSSDTLNYIESLNTLDFNQPISTIVWNISHYNQESLPINIVMQYIISTTTSNAIRTFAIHCMNDLSINRVGVQAILTKFVFECKFCV